jgi:hypothetical protein
MPNIKEFIEGDQGNIDACKYGMSIEGILEKPAVYYSQSDDD